MKIVQHNYEIISTTTEWLLQQQCKDLYESQHTCMLHGEDPSSTQVHLQINNCYVATDYQLALRHASTKPALDNYYIKKYGWSQPTIYVKQKKQTKAYQHTQKYIQLQNTLR
jgi:hypothetical protein